MVRSAHQRQTLMHTTTLGRRFEAVPQWIAGRLVSSDQYFLPLLFESGRWCPEHPEYPRPRQTTTSVPAMMHPCPLRMPPCRSVLPVTVTRAWLASRSGAASSKAAWHARLQLTRATTPRGGGVPCLAGCEPRRDTVSPGISRFVAHGTVLGGAATARLPVAAMRCASASVHGRFVL